ncbi:MAG: 30S ribosomal protein S9 [Candidatus Peribacter sp.]|jgi:small subunit ribosomal protein S9|nr:30S ribosomal protein S9 [Candidatus Peribacter sp.]MBT4392568.1 30S ribosomal protein S9 [Candidatus Peribacter sp.]MBT4601423.1 30S ribosomal protein S9 [Candidatus Peribacter sp.]MBT5149112.1 30S ribosomal protein S9 [Candidatus Peribacter sp.]MBT5638113.1 30S ribosomal protein S9 [Candidatus Peribacter sp.]
MTAATKSQYFYSAGKRKTAIARVKLFDGGKGDVTINGLPIRDYFPTFVHTENALAPLRITDLAKKYNVEIQVKGGGKAAQSDAARHGISRCLLLVDPELRPTLKREGFLRRDARIKERKKPGLKGARRAPQFSKR